MPPNLPHSHIVNVYSFDFDGCLFTGKYNLANTHLNDMPARIHMEHLGLLQTISQTPGQKIGLIGSARQSYPVDYINSTNNRSGSCFPIYQELYRKINLEFDPVLLNDLMNILEPGNTFYDALAACQNLSPPIPNSNDLFDETKLTLLYFQMHYIAKKNESSPIVFNFYDDRQDILDHVFSVFNSYRLLLPSNVSLKLVQYAPTNGIKREYPIINGSGFIDKNPKHVINEIFKIAKERSSSLQLPQLVHRSFETVLVEEDIRRLVATQCTANSPSVQNVSHIALLSTASAESQQNAVRFFPQLPRRTTHFQVALEAVYQTIDELEHHNNPMEKMFEMSWEREADGLLKVERSLNTFRKTLEQKISDASRMNDGSSAMNEVLDILRDLNKRLDKYPGGIFCGKLKEFFIEQQDTLTSCFY
jgi:hypothetical protein